VPDGESLTLLKTVTGSPGSGLAYSGKVQQRARTTASQYDRQHTELAGMTAERPVLPLVRDEEARARRVPDGAVNHGE
jgi:hypothetical protein